MQLLQTSVPGERRLSRWMAENWSVPADFSWPFTSCSHRIVLLDVTQIQSLIQHCGAALHATAIRHTISGATQSRYRQILGDAVYNFALKRAGLLLADIPEEHQSCQPALDDLELSIRQRGLECIQYCLADAPAELLTRCELMLPPDHSLPGPVAAPINADSIWKLVKRIVLTEISHELKPCFN